jgi:hypothetical protein
METRRRARSQQSTLPPDRQVRRREAEQASSVALPVGVALLILAVVLLFVVNTAWPFALAVLVIDALFLGAVIWHYRGR